MACDPAPHPLSELDMPKRAVNAFIHAGIRTVEEAAQWSDNVLLSLPQVGRRFLAALRAVQHRYREN